MLVDIWTYTCINWLRTLPSVRAWAEKYQAQGLVVLGVHDLAVGVIVLLVYPLASPLVVGSVAVCARLGGIAGSLMALRSR